MELDKKRLNVHLYVTPLCNLKCNHCYYDAWAIKDNFPHLLSVDEITHIITSLSDNFSVAFDVEGGEFFIRKDIYNIFKSVDPKYWKNVTITTNGTIPIIEGITCLQNLDEFRVSIEGHKDELQQELRGTNIAPIVRTCLQVQEFGVTPTLRITLTKKNYDQINDMLDYFLNLGLRRFSFYEFQPVGRGRQFEQLYALSAQNVEQILISLPSSPSFSEIDVLKFSFNTKRVSLLDTYKNMLKQKGFEMTDIWDVPSLTIDYDGALGICPWNIRGENLGLYQGVSFVEDVKNLLEKGMLNHTCDYCSAVRIIYKSSN